VPLSPDVLILSVSPSKSANISELHSTMELIQAAYCINKIMVQTLVRDSANITTRYRFRGAALCHLLQQEKTCRVVLNLLEPEFYI